MDREIYEYGYLCLTYANRSSLVQGDEISSQSRNISQKDFQSISQWRKGDYQNKRTLCLWAKIYKIMRRDEGTHQQLVIYLSTSDGWNQLVFLSKNIQKEWTR